MSGTLVVLLVVLAVLVLAAAALGGWCVWTAGRLDRMHLRLETARASLDALLQVRASLAIEIAPGLGDPASALAVMQAARDAREALAGSTAWQAQSDLSRTLRTVTLPAGEPLVDALVDASRRAGMARRIHNDLAGRTAELHAARRVHWFRLAGHAQAPPTVDFDDGADLDSWAR